MNQSYIRVDFKIADAIYLKSRSKEQKLVRHKLTPANKNRKADKIRKKIRK